MSRYTIDLQKEFDDMLSGLSDKKGVTKAEIIRQAVALYAYLQKNIDSRSGDTKLSITSDNDEVLKDIIIP